jgi:hypothetical protein
MADVMRLLAATALLATVLARPHTPPPPHTIRVGDTFPLVHANDNRAPSGRWHGDTLELRLEVRMATWRPEADSGP